jgi:Proteins containing SET domain
MILSSLFVKKTRNKGRGIFTSKFIPADTLIETSHVIVMDNKDWEKLNHTVMYYYIFEWDKNQCCMATGYVPLYNHACPSNCEYYMDYKKNIITIISVRDIKAGEELTINYNGEYNLDKPMWFETK